MRLRQGILDAGYPFMIDSPTNQQFPILPDAALEILKQKYSYATIQRIDADHTCVRFCTSWATRPEDVEALLGDLRDCAGGQ